MFRVLDLGFGVQGLSLAFWGLQFRVEGCTLMWEHSNKGESAGT